MKRSFISMATILAFVMITGFWECSCSDDGGGSGFYFVKETPLDVLAKTGQKTIYEPGDDADWSMGADWPDPRFTDNGDGTVTDNLTGLMWEQSPDTTTRTWSSALDYANSLTLGGHTDWRLPNRKELRSLVGNYGVADRATWLNGEVFNYVQSSNYWSSTTDASNSDNAWLIGTYGGGTVNSSKSSTLYFWAVRSGQTGVINLPQTGQTTSYYAGDDGDLQMGADWPDPRFTDNGDGTVTDNLTGLMWEQSPSTSVMDWSAALSYAGSLTTGEYTDWRLPNVNELESLVDVGEYTTPVLPEGHPFSNVQNVSYWSSTTSAYNTVTAWFIYMGSGICGANNKTNTDYVWAVRSGQQVGYLIIIYLIAQQKIDEKEQFRKVNPVLGLSCGI